MGVLPSNMRIVYNENGKSGCGSWDCSPQNVTFNLLLVFHFSESFKSLDFESKNGAV